MHHETPDRDARSIAVYLSAIHLSLFFFPPFTKQIVCFSCLSWKTTRARELFICTSERAHGGAVHGTQSPALQFTRRRELPVRAPSCRAKAEHTTQKSTSMGIGTAHPSPISVSASISGEKTTTTSPPHISRTGSAREKK